MKWKRVNNTNKEESFITKGWDAFYENYPVVGVIHNHLVDRLESLRTELENTTPDGLLPLQAAIKETNRFLEFIHSKNPRKDYYEEQTRTRK